MGEVYRADDLKLDHPVALKFLPPPVASDHVALARLHNEVRVARQVSHPNVCRIFDIAEAGGEHFVAMEYVDGEDLASLLRRIGRLPADKATEIARQLCAGLAAAHDAGILHRDLKPANVMIDGRGRVRITDFGLAELEERVDRREIAGTPAYMAPEQLTGGEPSVRSDIYALGLVLYEMVTGRPAFTADSLLDRARQANATTPPAPSAFAKEVDPAIDRIVQRCLERDPARRPASALSVAAALPGGDPLAAALAAGETPSPELVAAAGEVGALRPLIGWSLALGILALTACVAAVLDRVSLHALAGLDRPTVLLRERARALLERVGYPVGDRQSAGGISYDFKMILGPDGPSMLADWSRIVGLGSPVVTYWYRDSPAGLTPVGFTFRPTVDDPPLDDPGMRLVVLDPQGRLQRLTVVPPAVDPPAGTPYAAVDWTALFKEAGVDLSAFTPVPPNFTPPVFADGRAAWVPADPTAAGGVRRIEAATWRGQLVSFELATRWDPTDSLDARVRSPIAFLVIVLLVFGVVLGGSALLAARNVRLERSDRRGARRVAGAIFVLALLASVIQTRHVASLDEAFLLMRVLGWSVWWAVAFWILYLALEPFVRRRWPTLMTAWTRLIAGRVNDPLVGRDVLISGAIAVVVTAVYAGAMLVARRLGWGVRPWVSDAETLRGLDGAIGMALEVALLSLSNAQLFMAVMVIVTVVLRRRILAIAGFFLIVYAIFSANSFTPLEHALALLPPAIGTLLVVRLGMVAIISFHVYLFLIEWFPLTFRFGVGYAPAGVLAMGLIVLITGWALYVSLGGRPFAGLAAIDPD
jgi:serine/threonine-protein kinase